VRLEKFNHTHDFGKPAVRDADSTSPLAVKYFETDNEAILYAYEHNKKEDAKEKKPT
jgi:hypothetical protein